MDQDPDLKAMMEDIQRHGPGAVEKYLANEELMINGSSKWRCLTHRTRTTRCNICRSSSRSKHNE